MQATLLVYVLVSLKSMIMLGCKAFRWFNHWKYFKHTHQFTPTTQTHHHSSKHSSKKRHPTINYSSNHTPNQRSPTPEKVILALNKPQAWRLHPRGIVINTKHTNQSNCQHKLNAKQGYTSLIIKTTSITHSSTLNLACLQRKIKRSTNNNNYKPYIIPCKITHERILQGMGATARAICHHLRESNENYITNQASQWLD